MRFTVRPDFRFLGGHCGLRAHSHPRSRSNRVGVMLTPTNPRKATGTTMANPHPRRKDDHARGPSARPSSRPQRQANRDSPRSLLIGAWAMTLFALICFSFASYFTITEYHKYGYIHIHLLLTGVACSSIVGAVYSWYVWSRERRATRPSSRPQSGTSKSSPSGPKSPKSRGGA